MAAGIRSSNLPLGALVEVLGHAEAGNGQHILARSSIAALADAVRGIVISDPSGVISLRIALSALTNDVNKRALETDLVAVQRALDAVEDALSYKATQDSFDRELTALRQAIIAAQAAADGKATQATVDGQRYEYVRPPFRPGDGPGWFTRVADPSQLGGSGNTLPGVSNFSVTFGDAGSVLRVQGAGIVASRTAWPIEPGRTYAARYAYQRRANPSDPSNDSVRCLLVWLDQAKNVLSGSPFTVVRDDQALVTSNGRQELEKGFSRSGGADLLTVPPEARYARPAIQCFGVDGVTDIEVLDRIDTTDATLLPPVSASARADVDAILSQNLGPRLDTVEAQLGTPNSKTFLSKSDAQSGTIPVTVTTVLLLGRTEAGDGFEGRFRRISGDAPAGADTFVNAGQTWIRIPPAGEVALLTVQAAAQHLAALPTQPTASGTLYLNGQALSINP